MCVRDSERVVVCVGESMNRNKVCFRTFCRGNTTPTEMVGIALMWLLCSPASILSSSRSTKMFIRFLCMQYMFVYVYVKVNVLNFFFSLFDIHSFRLSRLNNFFFHSLVIYWWVSAECVRIVATLCFGISKYGDQSAKRRKNRVGLFGRMKIHRKGKEFYPMLSLSLSLALFPFLCTV